MDTFNIQVNVTNNTTGDQIFGLSMAGIKLEDIVTSDHATPGIDDVVKVLQGACEAYSQPV